MKRIGKVSQIISTIVLWGFFALIILMSIGQLSLRSQILGVQPTIGYYIGMFIAFIIVFFIFRLLFSPVCQLYDNYLLFEKGELTKVQFAKKWLSSMICTVIVSLLLFTIPFLIPHYIFLYKTKQ